jgi:hypothetical protein
MSPEEQRKSLVEQEKARLEAEEREKRLVHDRTIGGPMVPRPSRDFIEKSTGPLRSQEEISRLAEQRIDTQLRQADREKADKERFAKSAEAHNTRIADKQQDRTKDYWGKAQAQARENGPQRETTRDYWNGQSRPAPEHSQTQERTRQRDNDRERDR